MDRPELRRKAAETACWDLANIVKIHTYLLGSRRICSQKFILMITFVYVLLVNSSMIFVQRVQTYFIF
jgi:hypothetical protein